MESEQLQSREIGFGPPQWIVAGVSRANVFDTARRKPEKGRPQWRVPLSKLWGHHWKEPEGWRKRGKRKHWALETFKIWELQIWHDALRYLFVKQSVESWQIRSINQVRGRKSGLWWTVESCTHSVGCQGISSNLFKVSRPPIICQNRRRNDNRQAPSWAVDYNKTVMTSLGGNN